MQEATKQIDKIIHKQRKMLKTCETLGSFGKEIRFKFQKFPPFAGILISIYSTAIRH